MNTVRDHTVPLIEEQQKQRYPYTVAALLDAYGGHDEAKIIKSEPSFSNKMSNEDIFGTPALFTVMHSLAVLSVGLNIFAIYVILYQTPQRMKEFARYLLYYQISSTVVDIALMWLIAPWFSFPVLGLIPTGPLSAMGIPTGPQVVAGFTLLAFIIISMGELFFKRQQTILPDWSIFNCKVKRWKEYAWHSFLHSWVVIAIVLPSGILRFNTCDREMISRTYPELKPFTDHKDFICLAGEFISIAIYIMFFLAVQILYTLFILVLVISMIFHLHNFDIVSKKTRDMQRSLLRILIIQTVVPLGFMFVPMVICFYIVESGRTDLLDWNPWLVLVISMHGPCSTILILVLYKPYYRFLIGLVPKWLSISAKGALRSRILVVTVPQSTSYGPTTEPTQKSIKSKSIA